jgi:hypothetical protein
MTVADGSGPKYALFTNRLTISITKHHSFIKALFADAKWRENNAHLLQSLANPPKAAEVSVQANRLPPPEQARMLFDKYLTSSNILCPVLLRSDVNALFTRVFSTTAAPHPAPEDSFRAFMILAIGAVVPHRKGLHSNHPYGYYLSAIRAFRPNLNPSAGLRCILDLLLITRFGVYYNIGQTNRTAKQVRADMMIGVSIWDINQLCMRLCIGQNLHRSSSAAPSLLHEQLERRAFWECYRTDRYSSVVLGRPFAISDQEITVRLPVELGDEQIRAFEGQVTDLDSLVLHEWVLPSEMSVFCFCTKLRQISSRMRTLFSNANGRMTPSQESHDVLTATGEIYAALDDLLGDLDTWRDSAPVFTDPQSLYEMSEWYDLLRARERLIFIRKAVDLVPKRSSLPPIHLLELCLHAAADMITRYADLFDRKLVTHTRSYYQTLFLAGLSILFCVSVLPKSEDSLLLEAYQALGTCERTLRELGMNMPDVSICELNHTLVFLSFASGLFVHGFILQLLVKSSWPHRNFAGIPQPNPSMLGALTTHSTGIKFPPSLRSTFASCHAEAYGIDATLQGSKNY